MKKILFVADKEKLYEENPFLWLKRKGFMTIFMANKWAFGLVFKTQ